MFKICIRYLKSREIILLLSILLVVGIINISLRNSFIQNRYHESHFKEKRHINKIEVSKPLTIQRKITTKCNNANLKELVQKENPSTEKIIDTKIEDIINSTAFFSNDTNVNQTDLSVISLNKTLDQKSLFKKMLETKDYSKLCSNDKKSLKSHMFNVTNQAGLSDICERNYFTIFVIISPINDFNQREKMRRSFCSINRYKISKIKCLYFLTSKVVFTKKQISLYDQEFQQYFDSFLVDEVETLKTENRIYLKIIEMLTFHCQTANFFAFIKNPHFINVPTLLDAISSYVNIKKVTDDQELVLCKVNRRFKPIRNKKSQWFVSRQDYKSNIYPDFCNLDDVLILSNDVLKNIFMCSLFSKPLWITDVYITGILLNKLSIPLESFIENYSTNNMLNQYIFISIERNILLTNGANYPASTWEKIFKNSLTCVT